MKRNFNEWLDSVTSDETRASVQKSLIECDDDIKKSIKDTPTKWLDFHLENAVRDEHYELTQYIKIEKTLR